MNQLIKPSRIFVAVVVLFLTSFLSAQTVEDQKHLIALTQELEKIHATGREPNAKDWERLAEKYPKGIAIFAKQMGTTVEEFLDLTKLGTEEREEEIANDPVLLSKILNAAKEEEEPVSVPKPTFKNDRQLLRYILKETDDRNTRLSIKILIASLGANGMVPEDKPELREELDLLKVIYGEVGINNMKPEDLVLLSERLPNNQALKDEEGKNTTEQMVDFLKNTLSDPSFNAGYEQILLGSFSKTQSAIISQMVRKTEINSSNAGDLYDLILNLKNKLIERRRTKLEFINQSKHSEWKLKYNDWVNKDLTLHGLGRFSQKELYQNGITRDSIDRLLDLKGVLEDDINTSVNFPKSTANNWQTIHGNLRTGEAAIEIIRYQYFNPVETREVHYAALILTAEMKIPQLVVLRNGKELEVDILQQYFEQRSEFIEFSLSSALWTPIEKHLKEINKIYFSADGLYHQINIAMLPSTENGDQLLFDKYQIHLLNSTRSIASVKSSMLQEKAKKSAFLVGSPDYNATLSIPDKGIALYDRHWEDLIEAKQEVKVLSQLFSKQGLAIKVLEEQKAVEENIKPQSPSVFHIASHAFFDPVDSVLLKAAKDISRFSTDDEFDELSVSSFLGGVHFFKLNPFLRAGIALSGANTSVVSMLTPTYPDGYLMAYEIQHLNLQDTELVFLSACSGADGTISNSQGVYGLQRAFFLAGADCIIMNLWQVPDNIAREFSTLFYKNWFENGKTKREAFYLAQKKLRVQYEFAPYQWGGFIMIEI